MRTLTHSGKPSQKSILGQKAMIRSFVVSKLKKTTNSTKPETKLDLKV